MGRYARISRPGFVHHIINRGNNKQVVFLIDEDYREYLNTIERYKKKFKFKLYAFCLMPNHIHLLMRISESGSISKIMQSITVAHTRRFNDKYQRCGHVWQGRFLSPIVSDDEYFLNAMRYIEQNPVRAEMVKVIEDYRWSSHLLNIREKESVLIDRADNEIFQSFGDSDEKRIRKYKEVLSENLNEKDLKEIRKSTNQGTHYISEKCKEQMKFLLPGRKKGRPKVKIYNCL